MYIINFIPLNKIFNRSKVFFDFSECETMIDNLNSKEKSLLADCISKYSQTEWNNLLSNKILFQDLDTAIRSKLKNKNEDFFVLNLDTSFYILGYREKDRFRALHLKYL